MTEDPSDYVVVIAQADGQDGIDLDDIIEALPDLLASDPHGEDDEQDDDAADYVVVEASDAMADDPADPVAAMQAQLAHQQQAMVDQINHSGAAFDAQMAQLDHIGMGGMPGQSFDPIDGHHGDVHFGEG